LILVDTSVWIDHLHRADPRLVTLLTDAVVCIHPMVVGELALGSLRNRSTVLSLLDQLPSMSVATNAEVRHLIEVRALFGQGLSLVDAHLLAGLKISPGTGLWTRDRRLHAVATDLRVPTHS
jgi:predicted nucleic acid-binding protein